MTVGPAWLSDEQNWPLEILLEPSPESVDEAKAKREILSTAIPSQGVVDPTMDRCPLLKVLHIGAWVWWFVHYYQTQPSNRQSGPITADEVKTQELWWSNPNHQQHSFHRNKLLLKLLLNVQQVLECRGRIIQEYLVYLPDYHVFTQKLVFQTHLTALYREVEITMAKDRERFWIPQLRRLFKRLRGSCYRCKRFRAKAPEVPLLGNFPKTRTEGSRPFQMIGVDFTRPICYSPKATKESTACLGLYACSLTRTVHLHLMKSLHTSEFIASLKHFIAQRGRPEVIHSDNGSTFKAIEKWLQNIQHDKRFQFSHTEYIKWHFNLSHAP